MKPKLAAIAAMACLSLAACTTQDDVIDARLNLEHSRLDLHEAERYGSRLDVLEARRDELDARRRFDRTRRQYENENLCGPMHGLPC